MSEPRYDTRPAREATLLAIGRKVPSQGQALAGGSIPVVLPAAQESALRPPPAITGFATAVKQDLALAALSVLTGNGLTRAEKNGACAAAGADVIVASGSCQVRLHSLTVTMDAAAADGAWAIQDSDGATIYGPFLAPTVGGGIDRGEPVNRQTVITMPAAGKGLTIAATGANLHYHAVWSTEAVSGC